MDLRYRRHLLVPTLMAVALAGCTSDDAAPATDIPAAPDTAEAAELDDGGAEIPDDYLVLVLADVVALSGVAEADLTVLQATAVEWANQRLGCVHFDEPADPTPVDGYRVVVDTGDAEFDYRLDAGGAFRLCGDAVETSPDEGEHDEDDVPLEESSS